MIKHVRTKVRGLTTWNSQTAVQDQMTTRTASTALDEREERLRELE